MQTSFFSSIWTEHPSLFHLVLAEVRCKAMSPEPPTISQEGKKDNLKLNYKITFSLTFLSKAISVSDWSCGTEVGRLWQWTGERPDQQHNPSLHNRQDKQLCNNRGYAINNGFYLEQDIIRDRSFFLTTSCFHSPFTI